jgi:hypothetical protein
MSLRERTRPGLGIIEPCLPSPLKVPPSGPGWLHEIKHDGFRILARRDGAVVRLITRAGNDFSSRFPFIAMAVSKLPVRSCLIDGEAIVVDERGLSAFDLLRSWRQDHAAVLCAFDLIELDGKDTRRSPATTGRPANGNGESRRKKRDIECPPVASRRSLAMLRDKHQNSGIEVRYFACRVWGPSNVVLP